jgi:DNA-binding LacI/PurR family transcriptional regulator
VIGNARAAGVSLATVDRALKGRAGIAPGTAARVRDLAQRMGWRPTLLA